MRKLLFVIFFINILLFTGCETLPAGKPPVGPIVTSETVVEAYFWRGAKNYMLTSLTAFCLQNFPGGARFHLDFDNENMLLRNWSYDVLRSLRQTLPIRFADKADAEYILESGMDKDSFWSMNLINLKTRKKVWSERLRIKENAK